MRGGGTLVPPITTLMAWSGLVKIISRPETSPRRCACPALLMYRGGSGGGGGGGREQEQERCKSDQYPSCS